MNYMEYLKTENFPLFWCGGCGNGTVLRAIVRSFSNLGYTKEDTVVVTGIGCWGKADDYVSTNSFHGTHGRALAFATGIKLARPSLNVIVLMGDGDGVTIGGNHFIHAARRNVDLTAILVNNFNYGMTGGQYSGTTPENSITSTSRYGHIEQDFDICRLAEAAGAHFVARSSTENPLALEKLISEGLQKKGFSFIEAIAPCPTHFGKNNGMRSAVDLMKWTRERISKLAMGKIVDIEGEDYGTRYQKLIADVWDGQDDNRSR